MLFVFARVSDAVLRAGGALALAADSGDRVTVLACTVDPSRASVPISALCRLGVRDQLTLGARGARMSGAAERLYELSESDGSPGSLRSADPGEVAADIATVVATVGARTVISDAIDTDDPDAAVVARAARHASAVMAAEFMSVAVAGQDGARPRSAAGTRTIEVDIRSVLDRKRDAVEALGLTLSPDADREVERFTSDAPFPAETGERPVTWAEFGVGARIIALAAGLVVGAVVGALGTVVYQSGPTIGGVPIPVGLVGSLLVVAAILSGLRLVFQTRMIAASAAVGVLAVIGLFSLESPGGSVLIPAVTESYYWIYGPVLISFVVLGWPDVSRLRRVRIAEPQASKGSSAP